MKVIFFGLEQTGPLNARPEFRLVIKSTDSMHIEVKSEDQLGAVSWRPAKVDNNKLIPRLLARALLDAPGGETMSVGLVKP